MRRWILVGILAIAVIGTGAWGYQEHQEKNAMMIQAENNYQRAFHDLTYHMDLLHDKIGTTLALNTNEQLSPQLIDIWRLTSEAQMDVGQLPLALLPFNKTEQFLSEIGNFTYEVAVRNLEHDPLSEDEVEKLRQLYVSSDEIRQELRTVQHQVLNENLRWMDVELALLSNEGPYDNLIINGFETVEHAVQGYSEAQFPNLIAGMPEQHDGYLNISGRTLSEREAEEKVREEFNLNDDLTLSIAESGEGAQLPTYSASFDGQEEHGYVTLSKQGGHILSFMLNRDVNETQISLNDAQHRAEELLADQGLENMILLQGSQYSDSGVFQFIYQQDDYHVYPDRVQVKVALDNGDILGFTTRDYYRNHKEREIDEPKLTLEEAQDKVNPSVTIQDYHLAIVEDNRGDELVAYTFLGTIDNDTYRIVIDAETGMEVYVERLNDVESKWG
ncbi:spore germination protein [Natronobacillus azotifigens]|uniref:Germination protein YpeB n=1 Tax=Natronobacillus azotifigens TaxID=472978 RepID=A0A9J6R893_9BACI|nr:germination protein YpeB [Natronobacillus azotifigens]MCZ0701845.1 germination protein YpeB [Natronobacillus azotifigens]